MKIPAITFLFSLLFLSSFSQNITPAIQLLTSGQKTSIRGLSVVSDKIIWASGSNGTIAKSTDGGKSWQWLTVKGFENRDFRDIEAFDATAAVIIAVDTPAYILKTLDGGLSWKVVYENKQAGMFLDAMEFWNELSGIVIGDPIDNKFFIARTFDGGSSWTQIPTKYKPDALKGEALFAASGTNIRALDKDEAVFVTGGLHTRIFIRATPVNLPLLGGKETTGANSIAVMDHRKRKGGNKLVVVGGDFTNPASDSLNCFYSTNRGNSWVRPQIPPNGYKSCVEKVSKKALITCGLTGVDYSDDEGKTWKLISKESFHVCKKAKDGKSVFLAGSNGKIGKLTLK